MGGLFNINGKVYQFLEKLTNCVLVSILWTIFSIPIFTIGASTTALYYTVHKVIRHDTGHLWQTFWRTFKENFKRASGLWLLLVVVCVFLGIDCYFSYVVSDVNPVLQWILILLIVVAAVIIMWSLYWFAYIAHIDDPIKAVLKNTLIICVTNLGKSLSLLGAFALCIAIMIYLPFSPLFLLVLPAGYMYFATSVLKKVFNQYWDMDKSPLETSNAD